ncbi:hypothetical protein GCM10025859_42380 [Alicyclobacillus fastidiosus]|nr:hypothetical protein GCM10025859_42380 [Alicyclobacillus fastidiosus]
MSMASNWWMKVQLLETKISIASRRLPLLMDITDLSNGAIFALVSSTIFNSLYRE